jgi:segregation and condensation protein A
MEQTPDKAAYHVSLGGIFEGPMDLLVHLVRKHDVDIYDIPIALIAEQYMAYIKMMKALNIDVAGDFLVMAATLAYIKSRMLLPVDEEEEEAEDPRMELVRPLEEYLRLRHAAEDLACRPQLDWDVFVRSQTNGNGPPDEEGQDFIQVSLFELIDAFHKIIKRVSPEQFLNITLDTMSVKSRISEIADILESRGSVTFEEIFEGQVTKGHIIVTFLAILEMAKAQVIRVVQHVASGVIRIFNG